MLDAIRGNLNLSQFLNFIFIYVDNSTYTRRMYRKRNLRNSVVFSSLWYHVVRHFGISKFDTSIKQVYN